MRLQFDAECFLMPFLNPSLTLTHKNSPLPQDTLQLLLFLELISIINGLEKSPFKKMSVIPTYCFYLSSCSDQYLLSTYLIKLLAAVGGSVWHFATNRKRQDICFPGYISYLKVILK